MTDTSQPSKIIYLIRHGQSEGNIGASYQSPDSPLTELGRRQANHIAQRLSKLGIDTLVASPWTRARQTAEAISRVIDQDIAYSDLFVERKRPTRAQGKPKDGVEASRLERLWSDSLYDPDLRAEDGENFSDIIARSDAALSFLESAEGKAIAVVTHGYFMRTLVARVLLGDTLTPASFKSMQAHIGHQNAGLTVLTYGAAAHKPGWSLWIFNDHVHLAE